jgi:hypothetical protein
MDEMMMTTNGKRTGDGHAGSGRRGLGVALIVTMLGGAALGGRGDRDTPASPLEKSVQEFQKSNPGKAAEKRLAEITARVEMAITSLDPLSTKEWESLAAFAAQAHAPSAPGGKKSDFSQKAAKKAKGPSEPRAFPLPRDLYYRYGIRDLAPLETAEKPLAALLKKGAPPKPQDLSLATRLESLLKGARPDRELCLAGIQRVLDVSPRPDAYAQFLDSWRNRGPNGDESFYEALDRTAGTSEEVFFYDAMLGDFVGRFAAEEGKTWGLEERHDRNQSCFLAYRQYRGLIEAVAYSVLLPPDVPLPTRLARYDHGNQPVGLYTLRDEIDMLLEHEGGDVAKVVEMFRAFLEANPPPEKLWDGYEPIVAFSAKFKALVPELIDRSKLSTDDLLKQARARRQALADAVRAATADS